MRNPSSAQAQDQSKPRNHTRDQFVWLRQVLADPDVTPAIFAAAFVVADAINRGTKDSWPGIRTIADICGISKTTVKAAIELLVEHGHLAITRGRSGRDNSHHYRLVLMGQPLTHCQKRERVNPEQLMGQPATFNGSPTGTEPLEEPFDITERASGARSEFVDTAVNLDSEPVRESAPYGALDDFKKAYLPTYRGTPEDDAECKTILHRLQSKNISEVRIFGYVARAGRLQFEGAEEPLSDILRELDRG